MDECIFCKIVKGEIPCHKVYENTDVLAFLDIKPHAQGHTVVIPKLHAETLFELPDIKGKPMMDAIRKVMEKLKQKLSCDGFNVGWNHNSVAGQVVPHLHIHVLPRYNGDGGGSIHSIIKNQGNMSVDEIAKKFK